MKKRTIGILTFLAAAGASIFALTQGTPEPSQRPGEVPLAITIEATQPCGYVWAYHALPEISAEFQTAIQAILPEAEARAQAFGEDCVTESGSATFSPMETDFYVRLAVDDLQDNEALGALIEQVLPIVDEFARPRVPGPQDGFVEFTFFRGSDQRVLRVPIPLGKQLREQGVHGAKLIEALEAK